MKIVVGDRGVSIVVRGVEHWIFAERDDVLRIHAPGFDDAVFVDHLDDCTVERIQVEIIDVRTSEIVEVEVPAVASEPRAVGSNRARQVTEPVESPLQTHQRRQILEMVGRSYLDVPDQSKAFTASETHEIATEVFGDDTLHEVMRVAGVRAALTRGSYGIDVDDLVEKVANGDRIWP